MRAGQLDRRITIVKPPAQIDDPLYGPQPVPEGTPWDVVAARIPAQKLDDLPSKTESVAGGLRLSDHPARVRVRYRRDITSDMRVVLHGVADEVYEITSTPAEIGRREWLEFTVKAYSS